MLLKNIKQKTIKYFTNFRDTEFWLNIITFRIFRSPWNTQIIDKWKYGELTSNLTGYDCFNIQITLTALNKSVFLFNIFYIYNYFGAIFENFVFEIEKKKLDSKTGIETLDCFFYFLGLNFSNLGKRNLSSPDSGQNCSKSFSRDFWMESFKLYKFMVSSWHFKFEGKRRLRRLTREIWAIFLCQFPEFFFRFLGSPPPKVQTIFFNIVRSLHTDRSVITDP